MPTKFIFLILPQVHLLDLAGADQALHEAIDFGADFSMEYCGIDAEIETSAGLHIKKQVHFSEITYKTGDFILIPGARVKYLCSPHFNENKTLFDWLQTCYKQKVNLVSICAGAFVLGYAGLLNHVACTTHFQITQQFQAAFPQAKVQENILFVGENNLYTSAGIASGIDLTLHIIEQLTDAHFAHKVARELVIYRRRQGINAQNNVFFQFRNHVHIGVHKIQDFITENIQQKANLGELAEIACMSERNLTRIFKKETGCTIHEFITAIRKEKATQLLQNPDFSRKQIALQIGLESEKQLGRILKK